MTMKQAEEIIGTAVEQLDNASGELYNALDNLSRITVYLSPRIRQQLQILDITLIDSIKNELAELLGD